MAKKRDFSLEHEQLVDNTIIYPVEINDEMKKSFIAYAMAVNVSRAIPDVRDGLKPVHRRILYSMNEMGNTSDKPHKKCARIVGDVLGKFHPHGDSSVYGALVRFAQDFAIRYPLVDGHGNFGSVDGDPPAAYRYTEARLSKLADEMLRDIDKETVDFSPNFDASLKEPDVLPARFPSLLVNGSDGIAVGMATNIPPHNLNETIDAVIAEMNNPDMTIEEILQILPAPDYPTGGVIMGTEALKQAYLTGKGGVVIRSKADIEEDNDGKCRIVVTEIPYQVNKSEMIKQIAEMVKNKRIEGIQDIREESDRHGMRIVFEVKRDFNAQVVLNTLYKRTQLQCSYGINFLALVDGYPRVLNIKQILDCYIAHQKDVIYRRTKFDLAKAEERAHIIEGLVVALANIDEVIKIIKASKDRDEASKALQDAFLLSEVQAGAILDMRLQRLTSLEVEKLNNELAELRNLITELRGILASEEKIKQVIINELEDVKARYGDERSTEIDFNGSVDINIEDLIEKEDVVISMTHFGYVKRLPVTEYRQQHRGGMGSTGHKPKEEDFVEHMFICSTHNTLLFFTNKGKVYTLKGYEIPEEQKTARGRNIINLLPLEKDEKVEAILPKLTEGEGYLVMATRKGLIKKTATSEFESIRKTGKIAINLAEGDELISVEFSAGDSTIMVASNEGKCIRFDEKDVKPLGRDTMGVKAIDLSKDDYLVDMIVYKPGYDILTITENGYGKRTDITEYKIQNRNGKGMKAGIFNDKTGRLVGLKQVIESEDVMLIANNGVIIRTPAVSISKITRDTIGVKVMKLASGTTVSCVAIADNIAEDITGETEEEAIVVDEPIVTDAE
ncbi:MAG: DNA gyrase subunit A [Clostridiales bacterium]|nr:DNA gyrase subunit A [Clostridiales bacterium]